MCGPIVLNLYGSTTDTDVLWFASLWEIKGDGEEELLTRGWLRGSQRELDPDASKPWQPVHHHRERDPLEPNRVYGFNIEIRPYGILLPPGHRLKLKIKSVDDEPPKTFIENLVWARSGDRRRPMSPYTIVQTTLLICFFRSRAAIGWGRSSPEESCRPSACRSDGASRTDQDKVGFTTEAQGGIAANDTRRALTSRRGQRRRRIASLWRSGRKYRFSISHLVFTRSSFSFVGHSRDKAKYLL